MALSIYAQVEAMRKQWSNLDLIDRQRNLAHWEGELCPLRKTYRVAILYQLSKPRNRTSGPLVTVTDPLLRRRSADPKKPIPHVYGNRESPELPFLCLFNPHADEWHPRQKIAGTIVPWTVYWLTCYEGWLATGEWTGGG